jgi:hypothetical protein
MSAPTKIKAGASIMAKRIKRGLYAGRNIQFGNNVSEDGGNKCVSLAVHSRRTSPFHSPQTPTTPQPQSNTCRGAKSDFLF